MKNVLVGGDGIVATMSRVVLIGPDDAGGDVAPITPVVEPTGHPHRIGQPAEELQIIGRDEGGFAFGASREGERDLVGTRARIQRAEPSVKPGRIGPPPRRS